MSEGEEARYIIAAVFKRSGKKKLLNTEFSLILSMELRWLPPSKAKRFVEWSIENHLLEKLGEEVAPTFNIDEIKIPLDFKPSIKKWGMNKGLEERMIKYIERETSGENIVELVKKIEREKQIMKNVAILLAGLKLGVNMKEFIGEVEDSLYSTKEIDGHG